MQNLGLPRWLGLYINLSFFTVRWTNDKTKLGQNTAESPFLRITAEVAIKFEKQSFSKNSDHMQSCPLTKIEQSPRQVDSHFTDRCSFAHVHKNQIILMCFQSSEEEKNRSFPSTQLSCFDVSWCRSWKKSFPNLTRFPCQQRYSCRSHTKYVDAL